MSRKRPGARRIQVFSSALGFKARVEVYVYDSVELMRAAADRYSGHQGEFEALGITQCPDYPYLRGAEQAVVPIVRLSAEYLGTITVLHEMHHAAVAIYGSHLYVTGDTRAAVVVLRPDNEGFAHLYSDLATSLLVRLEQIGYYSPEGPR